MPRLHVALKSYNAQYIRKIRSGIIRWQGARCNAKGPDNQGHAVCGVCAIPPFAKGGKREHCMALTLDGCEKRELDYYLL
jgi:hypothetical protein